MKSALAGGWARRQERKEEWFCVVWVVFVLLFFSASKSKLVPYILPVYPALALLLGRFIAPMWDGTAAIRLRTAMVLLGILSLLLAVIGPFLLWQREWPTEALKWPLLSVLALGLFASAAIAFWSGGRGDPRRGFLAPVLCAVTLMLSFNPVAVQVMRPSAKAVCLFLKARLGADAAVFCLRDYHQDVPVYLGRLVGVADERFSNPNFEQSFGLQTENHWDRYLDRNQFLTLWRGPQRIYVIARRKEQAEFARENPDWHPSVVFASGNFVLLSNQPDS